MKQETSDDFVRYVIAIVRRCNPSFTDEMAERLENQLRHDYGGERPYIAKGERERYRKRALAVKSRIDKAKREKPISAIANEEGVSRRTLYRWIKRGDNDASDEASGGASQEDLHIKK